MTESRNEHPGDYYPGDMIAHYELVQKLGNGESERTFLAEDKRTDRSVVLKLAGGTGSSGPDDEQMIPPEFYDLAGLVHPNLLSIYEIGRFADGQYMALEYVEGLTLRELLEAGELSPEGIVDIIVGLLRGLEVIHRRGMTHGNIRPENIIVSTAGEVKLMGGGLWSSEIDYAGEVASSEAPAYLSPEQIENRQVDNRADLFSLGAVFYEMLSRKRAFRGETANDTEKAVLQYHPDFSVIDWSGYPPPFKGVVERLLDKNPDFRFQDTASVLAALESFRSAREPAVPISSVAVRRKDPWNRVVILAVIVLLAVAAYEYLPRIFSSMAERSEVDKATALAVSFDYEGPEEFAAEAGEIIESLSEGLARREFRVFGARVSAEIDYELSGSLRYERGEDSGAVFRLAMALRGAGGGNPVWSREFSIDREDYRRRVAVIVEELAEYLDSIR